MLTIKKINDGFLIVDVNTKEIKCGHNYPLLKNITLEKTQNGLSILNKTTKKM